MWTVRGRHCEVAAVWYDHRSIFWVPVTADGVSVTVEQIRLGEYNDGEQYVSITLPTEKELEILHSVGWEYDGCFAVKSSSEKGENDEAV